jgi:ketosteroid isomerase-like protein
VFIGDRGETSRGKEAIVAGFKSFLSDPAIKVDYKPGAKVFSESGDMAYSTAEYTETYTDSATKKLVNIKGTNLSVWKKQQDGSWKLVADSNPAGPTG